MNPFQSYNISVVGFSGPIEGIPSHGSIGAKDPDAIIDGIGKSSFCARFCSPHQVNNPEECCEHLNTDSNVTHI